MSYYELDIVEKKIQFDLNQIADSLAQFDLNLREFGKDLSELKVLIDKEKRIGN